MLWPYLAWVLGLPKGLGERRFQMGEGEGEFLKKRLTAIQVLISPRSSLPYQMWKLKSISDSSGWISLLNNCKFAFCLMTEPLLFWVLFLGRFFQAKAEQMPYFLLMQSIVRFCRFENWTCSFEMDCLPAAYYIIPLVNHIRNSL